MCKQQNKNFEKIYKIKYKQIKPHHIIVVEKRGVFFIEKIKKNTFENKIKILKIKT